MIFSTSTSLIILLTAPFTLGAPVSDSANSVPKGSILISDTVRGANYYYAAVHVGTPPQKEYLVFDTGSPTYSFEDSDSSFCTRSDTPCKKYGSFNNETSSTSKYAGPYFQDALIDFGAGDFLRDVVSIGNATLNDAYFGYITSYGFPDQVVKPSATILGLGLNCEDPSVPQCNGFGPYLLPELRNASLISRTAVSVYLGPNEPNSTKAELIFGGAYDKAKMDGKPFTVKMLDPFNPSANGQTNFANVTNISVNVPSGKHAKKTYSNSSATGEPYLLDTGNSFWYMPPKIFDVIQDAFGGNLTRNSANGAYEVDCKYRSPKHGRGEVTVDFGVGKIETPLHTLVDDNGNGRCSMFIAGGVNEGQNLGQPFLRSAYLIYDQEKFAITMSQSRFTKKRDLQSYDANTFPLTTFA